MSEEKSKVEIVIGKYRITTDSLSWVLSRKIEKEKGKEDLGHEWAAFEWHMTLPALLESMGEKELRRLPAKSLRDIAENQKVVQGQLSEIKSQLQFVV